MLEALEGNSLDTYSVYARITSTDYSYIHQILDFLNVLNIENNPNISDGYARTLAYVSGKRKYFVVPDKYKSSKWKFGYTFWSPSLWLARF